MDAASQLGQTLAVIPQGIHHQTQDEDCLFLDVIAPLKIFKEGQLKGSEKPKLAPVLVNIHGGGYCQGEKAGIYNPRGLLEQADNGFVFVSMNYRVWILLFPPYGAMYNNITSSSAHSAFSQISSSQKTT